MGDTPIKPGWYQDGRFWRYHDGASWTGHCSPTNPTLQPSFKPGTDVQPGPAEKREYPPGWYPDPWNPEAKEAGRYWDGKQWTGHVTKGLPVAPSPLLGAGLAAAGKVSEKEDSDERRERAETQAMMEGRSYWSPPLPDPLKQFLMALGFLFLLLVVVWLLLIPLLRGSDDPATAAGTTTTTTEPCIPGEFDAVGDPCDPTAIPPDPGTTTVPGSDEACVPFEYTGTLAGGTLNGGPGRVVYGHARVWMVEMCQIGFAADLLMEFGSAEDFTLSCTAVRVYGGSTLPGPMEQDDYEFTMQLGGNTGGTALGDPCPFTAGGEPDWDALSSSFRPDGFEQDPPVLSGLIADGEPRITSPNITIEVNSWTTVGLQLPERLSGD